MIGLASLLYNWGDAIKMTIKYTQKNGFTLTTNSGEIVLDQNNPRIITYENNKASKSEFIIETPGEYELGEITVFAYPPFPSLIVEIEQFTNIYLPTPPNALTEQLVEEFERVDILFLPGKRHDLISLLAPYYVIPLDDRSILADKMGVELPEVTKSITLKSRTDLPEETEILLLQ